MPALKLTTFNIEWMISVFGGAWTTWDGTIPASFPGKSLGGAKLAKIDDVPALCRRIAGVIKAIKPDILAVQEGPPRKDQMELFVQDFLAGGYVVHTSNAKNQALHCLVRKGLASKVTSYSPSGPETAPLRDKVPFYPWGGIAEAERAEHRFDRTPLVLTFNGGAGKVLRIVNVHTKSKFSKLKTLAQWQNRDREAILDALLARQKLSAEIRRLREYVLGELMLPVGGPDACVILGDFNDGAYAELMEREFLIHNVLDELVGTFLEPGQYFKHAMEPGVMANAATVSFADPLEGGAVVEELIDHVLVSPEIWQAGGAFAVKPGSCQVEMAAYAQFDATNSQRKRGDRPSDHRPVSVVLEY